MVDVNKLNLPSLERSYVVANTPGYLYRKFREDPSVESLAQSATAEELVEVVKACDGSDERSARSVTVAYAALIAMSFQSYGRVKPLLDEWEPKALSWGRQISRLIIVPSILTTSVSVQAPRGRIVIGSELRDVIRTTLEQP